MAQTPILNPPGKTYQLVGTINDFTHKSQLSSTRETSGARSYTYRRRKPFREVSAEVFACLLKFDPRLFCNFKQVSK
jgi:hypothetical protein